MPGKVLTESPLIRFPPCLFPVSATTACDSGLANRETLNSTLNGRWNDSESRFRDRGITFSSIAKAAWAITLQCYVSSEILCFEYHGRGDDKGDPGNGAGSDPTLAGPMLCIFRLDDTDNLLDLMKRLERGRVSRCLFSPTGQEILYVSPIVFADRWNTSLTFQDETCQYIHPDNSMLASSVLGTLSHILSDALTSPNVAVRDLEPCSYGDQQIIRQVTSRVSPVAKVCVHDLILKQCRLHPGRMAVCGWDGDLTYGELDDLSSRLAHHLVALGVQPETFVFSCFPKSTWAIVARLAILRAGGAYISIHATNPPAYLGSVVRRTQARIMLTDPAYADRFRGFVDTIVEVTPSFIHSLPEKKGSACTSVGPDNACLVLFTSGSTGEPKGIIQVHQSYSTACLDYIGNLGLGPHTRFLHFDDYAFDISNLELFVPLVTGGCCCVPSPMKTAQDLADNINLRQANIAFLTPTVVIKLDPATVPGLQTLCVGGEPLPRDVISKWANSRTKLINQYGMGEVAICCAFNDQVTPQTNDRIGRAASGTIWVVDPSSPHRLMPVGAVGELLMEGPHLSRRYLDQISRRSEAVFLSEAPVWMEQLHPDRHATARLYRSGDLGRLHHDGTVQYLGRKDTVLKLDGCRVEALEVEHQARQCLSSKDAVVVDLLGAVDGVTDPVLAAFLYLDHHPHSRTSTEPKPDAEPALRDASADQFAAAKVEEIRHCIAQALPAYMVPKLFILTTWLPRTASKKMDRKKIHMVGQKFYLNERLEKEKRFGVRVTVMDVPLPV
ncbi:Acetyl-CoA synthetase-like protein [Apiospora sp. TS-2023a]